MALETPIERISVQIFNVLEENYQVRQLSMLVAGSLSLLNPPITVELCETGLPKIVRNYRMSNAKLSKALNFTPSITVLESIQNMLQKLPLERIDEFSHPRYYNIKWMTLLEDVHAEQRQYATIY
jgi:nucleoside-diphosphate-sugar epimerase